MFDISKEIDSSPLAAYLYPNNKDIHEKFIERINAGGYCINDSMLQLLNHNLLLEVSILVVLVHIMVNIVLKLCLLENQ